MSAGKLSFEKRKTRPVNTLNILHGGDHLVQEAQNIKGHLQLAKQRDEESNSKLDAVAANHCSGVR